MPHPETADFLTPGHSVIRRQFPDLLRSDFDARSLEILDSCGLIPGLRDEYSAAFNDYAAQDICLSPAQALRHEATVQTLLDKLRHLIQASDLNRIAQIGAARLRRRNERDATNPLQKLSTAIDDFQACLTAGKCCISAPGKGAPRKSAYDRALMLFAEYWAELQMDETAHWTRVPHAEESVFIQFCRAVLTDIAPATECSVKALSRRFAKLKQSETQPQD